MKAIQLRPYQLQAMKAIQGALENGQKHIVVEMATGTGKGLVLAKTVELLHKQSMSNVLVVTKKTELKKQVEHNLFSIHQDYLLVDQDRITVATEQGLLRHSYEESNEYQFVIFDEIDVSESIYKKLNCIEKTVIVFSAKYTNKPHRLFTPKEVVFSYTYQQAVDEGYITPAMDVRAFGPAVEVFSKQLLEKFGYVQINAPSKTQDYGWDLVVEKDKQKIWVECKSYKSQVVSPSAASSLLNSIVWKRMQQKIPKEELILLIVFSKIPSFQKDVIYDRNRVIVWDIENLVFYSKDNPTLLKLLSQITYFPIDHIEGKRFDILEPTELSLSSTKEDNVPKEEIVEEAKKEQSETESLIQSLKDCVAGQQTYGEYEEICEKIIRTLFEANYFNRLTSQHKTNDKHFRMDLIGSLKINQNNEECMHPLWQMLVQHYNSHFVVFEFKNYAEEIDQNLIYITEKYLFDAALRNVAIIISHKGFSKSAKFAAEGCLKEHGKLILDITDKDLIKMLKLKSDKAADHILEKLEEFLMGISK